MKRRASKLLSVLLVLCMALALLPGTALAADESAAAADARTAMIAPIVSYQDGKATITLHELAPEEAEIYYAVNGYPAIGIPTSLYEGPFDASEGDLIRAIAVIPDDFHQMSDYSTYVVGLPSLGTPNGLEWGISYRYSSSTQEAVAAPGWTSWRTASPDQNQARVNIYRVGETSSVAGGWIRFSADDTPEYRSEYSFIRSDLGSGTYYFTVQSMGDDISYNSSEIVVSGTWTYTQPPDKLPTVQVGEWSVEDGHITANWTAIEHEQLARYEVDFYFSQSTDEEMRYIGGDSGIPWSYDTIRDELIQDHGDGYYYFQVRALTNDVTKYQNGEWSKMSEPYIVTEASDEVKDALDQIAAAGDDATLETVQEALGKIENLYTAMLADKGEEDGVIDKLAALEEAVGGEPAGITVSDELGSSFDASKVSMVGANLNKENADDEITLVVDRPAKEHVIDELYKNALAVQFSMDLQNQDGESLGEEKLAVPIQIKLPIPNNINPAFLVILHYGQNDSEPEPIRPHISYENGQYYAAFVLDHFSDFVMIVEESTVDDDGSDRDLAAIEDSVPGGSGAANTATGIVTASNPSTANGVVTANVSSARTGDTIIVSSTANSGYISAAPTVKDKNGNTVAVTKNADGTYSFTMPEGGVTITGSYVTPGQMFPDLNDGAWYREAIAYAVENGLMQGTGGGNFEPGVTTTRGMVMTILARQSGVNTTASGGEPWYQKGMDWAKQAGVSDGSDPEGSISREQLATMLYRYVGEPSVTGDLSPYPDAGNIHSWAGDAMIWAVRTGIIEGSDGKLNPQDNASRAEAAAMLTRFCKNIEK